MTSCVSPRPPPAATQRVNPTHRRARRRVQASRRGPRAGEARLNSSSARRTVHHQPANTIAHQDASLGRRQLRHGHAEKNFAGGLTSCVSPRPPPAATQRVNPTTGEPAGGCRQAGAVPGQARPRLNSSSARRTVHHQPANTIAHQDASLGRRQLRHGHAEKNFAGGFPVKSLRTAL